MEVGDGPRALDLFERSHRLAEEPETVESEARADSTSDPQTDP